MSTTADEGMTRLRAAHGRRRAAASPASPAPEDPVEAACAARALSADHGHNSDRQPQLSVERIGLTGVAAPLRAARR